MPPTQAIKTNPFKFIRIDYLFLLVLISAASHTPTSSSAIQAKVILLRGGGASGRGITFSRGTVNTTDSGLLAQAVVGVQKQKQHHSHRASQHSPKQRPIRNTTALRGMKPPARAQITQQVAQAAGHHHVQGLRARSPGRIDPLVEI